MNQQIPDKHRFDWIPAPTNAQITDSHKAIHEYTPFFPYKL